MLLQTTIAPPTGSFNNGQVAPVPGGKQGQPIIDMLHGEYYAAAYNGKLFKASVTGVTIPANGAAVAGKFALVNPAGSLVNAELVSTNISFNATATAVFFAYYWQNIILNVPTSPTTITALSGMVGAAAGNIVQAYSALTAAAATTPALYELIMAEQSTSALGQTIIESMHQGRIIIPPGIGLWLNASA